MQKVIRRHHRNYRIKRPDFIQEMEGGFFWALHERWDQIQKTTSW